MGKTVYSLANATAQWFASTHRGATFTYIEKVTLHTTEGPSWPGYDGGLIAPNLTASPDFRKKRLLWRQHFPINMSSRALQNRPGGVQTNLDQNVQVELVGTCERGGPGVYWPEAPDWCYQGLAEFLKWMNTEWQLLMNFAPVWLNYGPDPRRPGVTPAAYGLNNGVRLRGRAYDDFRGILGHQHTPENEHGDPGKLDIVRLQKFIGTVTITPAEKVYDMASFTEADIKRIVVDAIRDQTDEIATEVWNRFAVRDTSGNLVKPLAALQKVFQDADTPDLTDDELEAVLHKFAEILKDEIRNEPKPMG